MLLSLVVGLGAAHEYRRGYNTAYLVPAAIALGFTVQQTIVRGLSQDPLLFFAKKLALAYLAFGVGFTAFLVSH
jgi:hypothetical protein